jgi:hypothetical protein
MEKKKKKKTTRVLWMKFWNYLLFSTGVKAQTENVDKQSLLWDIYTIMELNNKWSIHTRR